MAETFNPNEMIFSRSRYVEEYDLDTDILSGKYTHLESPTLTLTSDTDEVTDENGNTVATFYKAQKGSFKWSNSFYSMDLAASQFCTTKEVASADGKITSIVSEVITLGSDATATLKYVPVGETGAEVAEATIIQDDGTFGDKYTVSSSAGEGVFTVDAENKKLTFPEGTTGKVAVHYNAEFSDAVKITKTGNSTPIVKKLVYYCFFADRCNPNKEYQGVIIMYKAQPDISSVELNFSRDGKHDATYNLLNGGCDDSAKLVDIIVYKE